MLYEYFRYCRIAKIEVTDLYIAGVAKSLRKPFNDDFDASALYDQAKLSYQEWFRLNKPNPDGTIWGITYPEQKIGLTYLVKQIAKNFDGSIPKIHPLWPVPDEDLI
jgi:hypothetical protein